MKLKRGILKTAEGKTVKCMAAHIRLLVISAETHAGRKGGRIYLK